MRLPCLLAISLIAAPLGACSVTKIFDAQENRHGNIVDPDALKELVPGTSTRADATSLLGSPTGHATFDDNTWIYIGQVTSSRIGRVPGIKQQPVVSLQFDQAGVLRNIQRLTVEDAKPVAIAAGSTPSPGSEASFMQQLLGNVGKFTPAGLPGGGGSGGGTSIGRSGNSLP